MKGLQETGSLDLGIEDIDLDIVESQRHRDRVLERLENPEQWGVVYGAFLLSDGIMREIETVQDLKEREIVK